MSRPLYHMEKAREQGKDGAFAVWQDYDDGPKMKFFANVGHALIYGMSLTDAILIACWDTNGFDWAHN